MNTLNKTPNSATAKTESVPKFSLSYILKNWRLPLLGLVLVAVVVGLIINDNHPTKNIPTSDCSASYRDDKTIKIGAQTIKAEAATTGAERETGLSGRPCIGKNEAMLFVFDKPGFYHFWMKDMKFPIDIIWISANHKTVGIERDVEPSTYPDSFINKDNAALYVLELASNRSTSLKIDTGTIINF